MAAVVSALGAWEQRPGRRTVSLAAREGAPLTAGRRALRIAGRLALSAAAVVVVAGVALGGLRLAQSAESPWGVTAAEAPLEVLTDAGEVTAVDDFGTGLPGEIVPVSAADFDPQGGDRAEMPELVPSAIDERSDTAWTTDTYFAADLDGKAGTGLMLDLGESLPVSAVRLELLGSGSSVKVLIGAEPFKKISKWTPLASAEGIGTAIDLRAPRPVVGRYVLVWFTQLPLVDGVYQGGIRDVTVLR
jgi:hypothetical protein